MASTKEMQEGVTSAEAPSGHKLLGRVAFVTCGTRVTAAARLAVTEPVVPAPPAPPLASEQMREAFA